MTILVTRPFIESEILVKRLLFLGKVAFSLPLISFEPSSNLHILPNKFALLSKNDLIFILSKRSILYVHEFFKGLNFSWPKEIFYYTIGSSTASFIFKIIKSPIFFPKKVFTTEMLINLPTLKEIKGKKALVLHSNCTRNLLLDTLVSRGVDVISFQCYKQVKIKVNIYKVLEIFKKFKIKILVVTSGEILKLLYSLFFLNSNKIKYLLNCKIIVVSERLAILAYKLGWRSIYISNGADNDSLILALHSNFFRKFFYY